MKKPRPTNPELIPLTEAAKRLGVHYRTIRRWIAEGRIDAVRVGPRMLKIDAAQLDRLVNPIGGGAL
ncbi:excisionase family DNA-binding protein [Mycolicibacterium peregrinum]|uniref:excisionase family DNA-binding protein n=1 Tax=Mycolicibacterium peregrinum TaxID=43304 RepID=UPI0006D8468C|nr:excisionase family DNA-binding protein [Mycolicibacterium peregrinum]MCV7204656.1 excisionase family DNA-binding protein [Mycolicibacterium peregrinum]ORW60076.1 hypothetical protein AWC21_11380 [Mycolicibacterium peregrinum]